MNQASNSEDAEWAAELNAAIAHEEPLFARAVIAVVTADVNELRHVLRESPELVRARSRSEHHATLLHYVTSNAIEDALQLSPLQIYNVIRDAQGPEREQAVIRALEVPKILFEAGAEIDALADAYGGGKAQTPLNWLVSSGHPSVAGVLAELTSLFCDAGANVDGLEGDSSPVVTALGFGHFQAAESLFEHGCRRDNLLLAAAAGDCEQLNAYRVAVDTESENGGWAFETGDLERIESNWFHPPKDQQGAAELALVFASMCGRLEAIRFLVDSGVDLNAVPVGTFMTSAPLHTAALVCQQSSVDLLIELGADPTVVETRYQGNAMGWAREGKCKSIIQKVGHYLPEFLRQKYADDSVLKQFVELIFAGDANSIREFLNDHPLTAEQINGPWFYFDSPAIVQCKKNLQIVDCLLEAGADIQQKSMWWAGGFGVLDETEPDLAEALMERGAKLDVWSAASLNRLQELEALLDEEPSRIHARGPDGKTPLHCVKSLETAKLLVARDAKLNVRCWDHDSTPLQYLVAEHAEVASYLVEQGCDADIMAAAVLGDISLAEKILAVDPTAIDACIDRKSFPSSAADNIYSWTIGWYLTPHQVAEKFRQSEMLEFLMEQGTPETQFLNACLLGKSERIADVLQKHPDIADSLTTTHTQHLAHAARNNQTAIVSRLLEQGFPVQSTGQHGATPLHWACFHGNAAMVEGVLKYQPPLELRDQDFKSTPLGWATHGSLNGWHRDTGDYLKVVQRLVQAGAQVEKPWKPIGHSEIDTFLSSF